MMAWPNIHPDQLVEGLTTQLGDQVRIPVPARAMTFDRLTYSQKLHVIWQLSDLAIRYSQNIDDERNRRRLAAWARLESYVTQGLV